jgi:Protein of unknown function (DUF1194)
MNVSAVRSIPSVSLAVTALTFLLLLESGHPARADGPDTAVDAAVVMAADVSRSINDDEFSLQQKGYADAITSPQLLDAIKTGTHGAIALCFVEWAGADEQKVVVEWAVIRNAADAQRFADALLASQRTFVGRTAIGSAIDFAWGLNAETAFHADRHIIDVSGDGTSNQGRSVEEARDEAVKAGAIINGLSIFNQRAAAMNNYLALHTNPPGGLANYYKDHVIGGPGSFVLPIDNFGSFGDAMVHKLLQEISAGPPSPVSERRAL